MKISEVSKTFNIPISTLRYYDEEGLFPNLSRNKNGQREFQKEELEGLKVIECLKTSGLSIKEIKEFIELVKMGDSTISQRKQLFNDRLEQITKEINKLQQTKDILEFKKWYYTEAERLGSEEFIQKVEVPEEFVEIKKYLDC